jgi:hypothetical protein
MTAPDEREQFVDPYVSRSKFEAEVALYRGMEREHQLRGWWMLDAEFPTVFVVFATPQLRPPAVICGVIIDFTNYDVVAPSVRLVDPFTRQPYRGKELPTVLLRQQIQSLQGVSMAGQQGGVGQLRMTRAVPLMQFHDPEDVPFLCIPGVREYHTHPAHTSDDWLTHRSNGAGTLFNILSVIYRYGVQPINSFTIGMHVEGFQQGDPPP